MNRLMTYEESKLTIDANSLPCVSPDYYRVKECKELALGLKDSAIKILMDMIADGNQQSIEMFEKAKLIGFVDIVSHNHEGNVEMPLWDVVIGGNDRYFKSHIAMQIAFPDLYKDYFGGENVWDKEDERFKALLNLSISCLTNNLHPSDYYGYHMIEDTPKRGRPKIASNEPKSDFSDWVKDCQDYKRELSNAWKKYLAACNERKQMEVKAKEWRDRELDRLREEMSKVSAQYEKGMQYYTDKINEAKEAHRRIKDMGKPKRKN